MANSRLCSIPDCGKPFLARGYCNAHYIRMRSHGDPLADMKVVHRVSSREAGALCAIAGCEKPARRRGWCSAHHSRWIRHGDPLAGRAFYGEPEQFLSRVLEYEGHECQIWPFAKAGDGYAQITRGGVHIYVHRLVCERVNGPPPSSEHEAAHSCGRGHEACVTKRHVSWKTHAENEADKVAHDTHCRGERSNFAKLTEREVREIISLKGIMTKSAIAKAFGVSRPAISLIHSGKNWAWLPRSD